MDFLCETCTIKDNIIYEQNEHFICLVGIFFRGRCTTRLIHTQPRAPHVILHPCQTAGITFQIANKWHSARTHQKERAHACDVGLYSFDRGSQSNAGVFSAITNAISAMNIYCNFSVSRKCSSNSLSSPRFHLSRSFTFKILLVLSKIQYVRLRCIFKTLTQA